MTPMPGFNARSQENGGGSRPWYPAALRLPPEFHVVQIGTTIAEAVEGIVDEWTCRRRVTWAQVICYPSPIKEITRGQVPMPTLHPTPYAPVLVLEEVKVKCECKW